MSVPVHSEFVRRFEAAKPALQAFIASVVQDAGAREDILQATALTLWEKFASYDPARPFGAWARGVAARKITHDFRRRSRFPRTLEPAAIEAMRQAFDRRESSPGRGDVRTDALRRCLERLPAASRELVALRYDEGLACDAIARRLGRSVDAIHQHLSRVRSKLAECIRRHLSV